MANAMAVESPITFSDVDCFVGLHIQEIRTYPGVYPVYRELLAECASQEAKSVSPDEKLTVEAQKRFHILARMIAKIEQASR